MRVEFYTTPQQAYYSSTTNSEANRLGAELLGVSQLRHAIQNMRQEIVHIYNMLGAKDSEGIKAAQQSLLSAHMDLLEARHNIELAEAELWESLQGTGFDERMVKTK